jgi:hypothetical protein
MKNGKQVPKVPDLLKHNRTLARIVAESSYLPSRSIVKMFRGHVFPTVRRRKGNQLCSTFKMSRGHRGMYDDNTTPRWALMWTHGYSQTKHHSGWTFAHVWTAADKISSYTHLANLVMVPECLASLTDKNGPLVAFFRWHAWHVYGWKPNGAAKPSRPKHYEKIKWKYLEGVENPKSFIKERLGSLNNNRVKTLRKLEMRNTAK